MTCALSRKTFLKIDFEIEQLIQNIIGPYLQQSAVAVFAVTDGVLGVHSTLPGGLPSHDHRGPVCITLWFNNNVDMVYVATL